MCGLHRGHLTERLLREGFEVIGIDCFTDYYSKEIMEKKNSIGITMVKDVSSYGEVWFEGGYLKVIREKTGFGDGFVNAGICHLTPTILDCVEGMEESERKEYELTGSVRMLNEKEQVKVIPLNGYWNDIGYPWDYIDANRYMLERIKFGVGENTEIWDSAIIRKPAVYRKRLRDKELCS
mgnify:FL=1